MTTRRDLIEKAFEKSTAAPSKGLIAERLMALKPGEHLPIGTVGRALKEMTFEDRKAVLDAVSNVLDEEELGPVHGQGRDYVLTQHVANTPAMHRLVEHVEVEAVATALMNKRGNDSSLPPPEMTQRDVISAAYDAHFNGASDE